mgnify:CR=1 FL=1
MGALKLSIKFTEVTQNLKQRKQKRQKRKRQYDHVGGNLSDAAGSQGLPAATRPERDKEGFDPES